MHTALPTKRSPRLAFHRSPSNGSGSNRKRALLYFQLFLALSLLLPLRAFGAIAIDSLTNQIGTASTISWNHTTNGSNRLLIVSVATRLNRTVTGVTYGGHNLTSLGAQNNDNNSVRIEMWYLALEPLVPPLNPGTPYLVVVNLSASANVVGNAISFTGVNQAAPLGTFQSAGSTGPGSNAPSVIVPSTTGDLVLDSVATEGNFATFTQGAGQIQRWARWTGTTAADAAQAGSTEPGAAPSVLMDWTVGTSVRWAIGGISIRPVTISGTVFEDANFAGTASEYDGGIGDLGLPNVDVELYNGSTNAYITSTTTAADGSYSFFGLANGTYKVRVRSATIGDADTPPRGGLNGTVPSTWPYPLAEMTWANGAFLYGGVSPTVDDTETADNAGPGDTYATVTVANGADVPNVNFGFAYNLIVNVTDDFPTRPDNTRSTQGSLRQFIKNANAIGAGGGTTANSSQFRMQMPTNQSSGGDSWWRITALQALPPIADSGTILDGSTQRLNSGVNSNTRGSEIEITGTSSIGLQLGGSSSTIRELVITSFSLNGIHINGSSNGNRIEGCYVGIDATGTTARGIGEDGILINGNNNVIGGTTTAQRNVISGNADEGIDINPLPTATGNVIIGNYIGTNATATAVVRNGPGFFTTSSGGIIVSGNGNRIGGSAPGEGNVIAGNNDTGIRIADGASGNVVYGNFIGANASGATFGNVSSGIIIELNSPNNTIGGTSLGEKGNVIAYNGGDGVFVTGISTDGNRISGNSIYGNTGLGIDLDPNGVGTGGGANNDKTRPVITGITPSGADFIVTATATSGDTVEFFRANNSPVPLVNPDPGGGEGYLYLGSCVDNGVCSGPHISGVADGNGTLGTVLATLLASGVTAGDIISSTATDTVNNTSEFSANVVAPVELAIVKQAWLENGSAPLASPLTAPAGSTIVFLIYVRNTSAIAVNDVRINDSLDETAFQYVAGSLVRTNAATPPADTATDLEIFNATAPAPGPGTGLTDPAEPLGDVASALDTGGLADADRITIGAVTGQTNGSLSIASHATFALRFKVIVK